MRRARLSIRTAAPAALLIALMMLTLAGGYVLASDESPLPAAPLASASPSPPSPDAWHQAAATGGDALDFVDVVATDEGFAALGWRQGSRRRGDEVVAPVWRSHDGAIWRPDEPIPLADRARASRLAVLDGDLYAIGMAGTHLAVWRASVDGAWHRLKDRPFWRASVDGAWHRLKDRPSFAANPPGTGMRFGADIRDVASGHGRIVVSGDYWTLAADPEVEPVTWTSVDGRRWQRSHQDLPPPDNGIHDLAVTPSGFVGLVATNRSTDCLSGAENGLALASADGRTWRRATRKAFGCGVSDITHEPVSRRYYALAEAPDDDDAAVAVVLASDDLRAWPEAYRMPSALQGQPWSPSGTGIDSAGGYIVVVGDASWGGDRDGGTVWALVSTDGETWQLTADWPQGDGRLEEVEGWAMDETRLVVDAGAGVWYADLADLAPPR